MQIRDELAMRLFTWLYYVRLYVTLLTFTVIDVAYCKCVYILCTHGPYGLLYFWINHEESLGPYLPIKQQLRLWTDWAELMLTKWFIKFFTILRATMLWQLELGAHSFCWFCDVAALSRQL